jgi:hypothetical protein
VGARRHDCPRRSATMAARTASNGARGCRQGPQIRTLPTPRGSDVALAATKGYAFTAFSRLMRLKSRGMCPLRVPREIFG